MSASRQATWWESLLHRLPFTTLWCPGGNRHFRWRKICFCENGQNGWGVMLYYHNGWWLNLTGSHAGTIVSGRELPSKLRNDP